MTLLGGDQHSQLGGFKRHQVDLELRDPATEGGAEGCRTGLGEALQTLDRCPGSRRAGKVESGGKPIIQDSAFREKLAACEIELKALELTQLRVVADEGKHGKGKPNPASSVLKIKGSEIQQATTELLMEVIGPFAAPFDEHGDDGSNEAMDWTAQIAPSYFNNRKVSIYGGSNEIQRNIISKAVLGL